jgi:threonine synthase
LDDLAFAILAEELDAAVARVDGTGFRRTPFLQTDDLANTIGIDPGCLWVKDETGNVSGSHKGRHLMGLMLWMEMARRVFPTAPDPARQLAIASCGNAALAAAVVARAANRALDVFIPTSADASVVDSLRNLRARLVTCPRDESLPGDPCFHRFREAVEEGALPFTCQGSENSLVIEGCKTLAWEMVSELARGGHRLDHLFVQVGGGALGSACFQGLREARDLGALDRLPAIHTVQTAGASPLHRAWDTIMDSILLRHQRETKQAAPLLSGDPERAQFVRDEVSPLLVWFSLVEGMLITGGLPLVVSEDTLTEAQHLAREHSEIPADPTGTAGLAGLLEMQQQEMLPGDEVSAVLFTGIER